MKLKIFLEVLTFIVLCVCVVYFDIIKSVIIYLLLCETISSVTSIMKKELEERKRFNEMVEDIKNRLKI